MTNGYNAYCSEKPYISIFGNSGTWYITVMSIITNKYKAGFFLPHQVWDSHGYFSPSSCVDSHGKQLGLSEVEFLGGVVGGGGTMRVHT